MTDATRVSRLRAAALAGLLAALPAFAQGTSVLTGTVSDASNEKPIENVVVTATSPSLQGEQVGVTDAAGLFRLPQLPSGAYTLRFEAEGYKPYAREGISLRLDTTVRVNTQLLPTELGETVIVRAIPPTVDVVSSRTGVNVDSEMMRRLPVVLPAGKGAAARSFESVAELAPGAAADTFGVSVSGTTSPENGYVLDGTSVNDPAFGINGTPLSMEFIGEVNIITGGYMPEYGRATGGVVNAVTKSGSNEFHGSVFGNVAPGVLVAPGTQIRQESGTVAGDANLWNLGDFGAELGGPILKDRLWFYAGLAPSFTRFAINRELRAEQVDAAGNPVLDEQGNHATTAIAGTQKRYFADLKSLQYIGKLTYLLNSDHNLTLSVSGTPTRTGGNGTFAVDDRIGQPEVVRMNGMYSALATQRIADSLDGSLKWAGAFLDKQLLLDGTVGYHRQDRALRASDGTGAKNLTGLAARPLVVIARTEGGQHSLLEYEDLADPSACGDSGARCPVLNYFAGGPGFLSEITMDRWQGKLVGTGMFNALGHHVFKAGIDGELMRFDQTKAYTGRVAYFESDDGTYFSDFRQFGYLTGPDQAVIQDVQQAVSTSTTLGGFVQDSWNVADLFLVNVGVRYDAQILYGGGQRAMVMPNQISPRAGLIYDLTREGRSKLFANFARYYESVPLDIIDRQFPGERQLISLKDATVCDPLDPAQYEQCMSDDARLDFRPMSDASRRWQTTGGVPSIVDPELTPQSSDELVLGGEYELFTGARAGATYTRRYMTSVVEDMSRDDGATYFIGNPGEGFAKDFPEATRNYDAVTVYLQRDFKDSWLVQASYTWSQLQGNYEGLFRADTQQLDPNNNSDFDLLNLLPNRTGPLPADRTHQLKVFGSKEFKLGRFGVNLGGGYRGASGTPTNYLGAHEAYGPGEAYLLPRGAGGRLPWVHRLDGHVGVSYALGRDSTLTLSADVFNAFNFQAVTAVDENYTFSEALPIENGSVEDLDQLTDPSGDLLPASARNPNFGQATAYQTPRSVRFGLRLTF